MRIDVCPLSEIILTNIQLNDKAGQKLMSALTTGLGKGDCGYEKITALNLSQNELGKGFITALKQMLWGERAPCMLQTLDVSNNPTLDGYDLGLALKRNESLTSLNISDIPSANTDDVYSFIGAFLLQDDCRCRIGFLSCDAFQTVAGQTELVLDKANFEKKVDEGAVDEEGNPTLPGTMSTNAVIMLLAGVVKFNTSLKNLTLANTGLETKAAGYFATALQENKVLEHLDLSGNPIEGEGIIDIAEAARTHPTLARVKLDGEALDLKLLRGGKSAETVIEFGDKMLGELSGHTIGIVAKNNRTMQQLILKSNPLGAHGLNAVVSGLGEAPLKALDLTRTGIGSEQPEVIENLSVSICRHVGALMDLRVDENEMDCPASALAPLCKLRSLRTLSLEKNRLSEVPALWHHALAA